MPLPDLSTPRLLLREFTRADFAALREIDSDPEVLRYRSRSVIPEEETRRFLEDCLSQQNKQPRDKYPWAIVLRSEDVLVGQIGLTWLPEDELQPGHLPGMEAFLWGSLNRRCWNQGLMSEALPVVIAYGFRQVGFLIIHGRARVENIGSWRAMEKAGLKRVGVFQPTDQGPAFYDYALTKDDFAF